MFITDSHKIANYGDYGKGDNVKSMFLTSRGRSDPFEAILSDVGEGVPGKSPSPKIANLSRSVHSGFAAQTDHVLERSDGQAGSGLPDTLDVIPVQFTSVRASVAQYGSTLCVHMFLGACAVSSGLAAEKPEDGIIVMGARVGDAFVGVVFWDVFFCQGVCSEGELHDLHPGKSLAFS